MTIISLGPFCLDTRNDLLLRGTEPVALGKRAVVLLRTLVERPGELVSKDALLEAAWAGLVVEESNLTVQIAALRRVLGEEPGGERWIETMSRRGYRFIGPVVTEIQKGVIAAPPQRDSVLPAAAIVDSAATPAEPARPPAAAPVELMLALHDKPSIAVLPFQNMSGDPEREYFVDGMVEEIITALSRIRWLFVIARNSSFTYKGQAVDVKQVGRELGVRYVLEGSVRKAGNRVRITAQLIEAETGAHLWADRFDGSLDDVFDLQDQVATGVSGVIEPTLREAEGKRSARRPTNDQTAYDLYLRAWPLMSTWAKEPVAQALGLLERAIDRDPRYGPALAVAAFCYSQRVWSGWTDNPEKERGIGIERARQALQYARHDPNVVFMAAGALADFGDDITILTGLIDNALARNPSSALGWFWSGWMRVWSGDTALAIEHFETSLRLDPRTTRRAFHLTGIGIAQFFQRRFDDAAATLQASLHEVPSYPTTARMLAACYAHMGRLDDARALVAHLVDEHAPTPTQWSIFGNPEQRELVLSGLRLAMGEER